MVFVRPLISLPRTLKLYIKLHKNKFWEELVIVVIMHMATWQWWLWWVYFFLFCYNMFSSTF